MPDMTYQELCKLIVLHFPEYRLVTAQITPVANGSLAPVDVLMFKVEKAPVVV